MNTNTVAGKLEGKLCYESTNLVAGEPLGDDLVVKYRTLAWAQTHRLFPLSNGARKITLQIVEQKKQKGRIKKSNQKKSRNENKEDKEDNTRRVCFQIRVRRIPVDVYHFPNIDGEEGGYYIFINKGDEYDILIENRTGNPEGVMVKAFVDGKPTGEEYLIQDNDVIYGFHVGYKNDGDETSEEIVQKFKFTEPPVQTKNPKQNDSSQSPKNELGTIRLAIFRAVEPAPPVSESIIKGKKKRKSTSSNSSTSRRRHKTRKSQ